MKRGHFSTQKEYPRLKRGVSPYLIQQVEYMNLRKIITAICIFAISILFIDGLAIIHFVDYQLNMKMKNYQFVLDDGLNKSEFENTTKNLPDYLIKNSQNHINRNNSGIIQNNILPLRERPENQNYPESRGEKPVNLLILGLDKDKARADVILVVNYRPWKDSLNMISIPRDTKVIINGENSKINAMIGMGGEEFVISKVERITGLYMDYYVTVDLEAFRKIVDELGGVEINVPFDMVYDDPEQDLHINLKKGVQLLDGNKAEQFVRYRKGNAPQTGYIDGDIGRINAQQVFIKALIEQKLNFKYLHKLDEIYDILSKYTKTNIKLKDLMYYLRNVRDIKISKINNFTLPGEAEIIDNIWYYVFDVEKTRELISTYFYK